MTEGINPKVGANLVSWETFPECPDCGGRDWHFGSGGASINIRCLGCHAWFNAVFLIQRISPAGDS